MTPLLKKSLRCLGLVLMLTITIVSTVYATVVYTCALGVHNTGSALTYKPFSALMSNSTMATNSFILSSGLDVLVKDGVTSVPCLIASDRTLFVGGVGAGAFKTFSYSTGNAPLSVMPIIIGYGGYISTTEIAALDLGSNFSVTIVGRIDTSVACSTGPMYKQGSIELYVSAVDTLTACILDAGGVPIVTVAKAGVTSGLHTIVVYGDGVNFGLQVDGGAPATAGIGAGVTISAHPYLWNQGNSMSYITSIVIVVGGVEKLKYQPSTMVISSSSTTATLPDLDSTQNGIITWGTNYPGVSVSVGSMEVVSTPITPTPSVPSAPNVVRGITGAPGAPTSAVNPNFPLYGIFDMGAQLLQVPTVVLINIGMIFFIVGTGLVCILGRFGPMMTGAVFIFEYVVLNLMNVDEYWMVFMMVTLVIISWMLPRQTAVL